jgi:hypothetical protein
MQLASSGQSSFGCKASCLTCLVAAGDTVPSPPDYDGNGGFVPPSAPSGGAPAAPPAFDPGYSADSPSNQDLQLGLAIGLSLGLAAVVCGVLGSWWYFTKRRAQAYLHGMPDKLKQEGLTGHSPPHGSDSGVGSSSGDGTWPGTGTPDRGRQHSPSTGAATPSSSSSASKQLVGAAVRPASAPHHHAVHILPPPVPESASGPIHHAGWIPGGGTVRDHSSTTASSIPSQASNCTASLETGPAHMQDVAHGSTGGPAPPGSWDIEAQSQGLSKGQVVADGGLAVGPNSMAAASMPGPWAGSTAGSPVQPVLSATSAEPGLCEAHNGSKEGSRTSPASAGSPLVRLSVPAVIQQTDGLPGSEQLASVSQAPAERRPHSSGASATARRQAPISCLQLLGPPAKLAPQQAPQQEQQEQLLQPINVSQVTISPEGMPSVQVATVTPSQTAGSAARDGNIPLQETAQLASSHSNGEQPTTQGSADAFPSPTLISLASSSLPVAVEHGHTDHASTGARASSSEACTGTSTAVPLQPAQQLGGLTAASKSLATASLATSSTGGASPGAGLSATSNAQQSVDAPLQAAASGLGRASAGAVQVPEPVREIEQLINELRGGEGSELTILHPIGQGGFGTVYKGEECNMHPGIDLPGCWLVSACRLTTYPVVLWSSIPQDSGGTLKSQ